MTTGNVQDAVKFMGSFRGQYILARALQHGIAELSKVEGAHREESDIADMKYLRDEIFSFPVEELGTHDRHGRG